MLHGYRVLAVDGDVSTVSFYADVLKRHRADLRVARCGKEALEQVGPTWVPHVLVVSLALKDVPARALVEAVRRQAADRVAVVCTTRDEGAFARAKAKGFDECLVVPVDVGELVAAVGRAAKAARTEGS